MVHGTSNNNAKIDDFNNLAKYFRQARACLGCSQIKTFDQFEFDGCDNCDEFLHMKNSRDNVYNCTSSNFDGMIALMDPKDSWVAKWQRINRFVPGVYAISVAGRLPHSAITEMQRRGIVYKQRDLADRR
ncbi:hypothetical protein M8J76_007961 [Diaphorina citri]|nr:hypothetical protein M8J75_001786 [Diaphorina citri]KAI5740859.1 hypothetical protein M8J76_007961 [Diaphorina citri]KAI5747729.1 hypothetical protein M8J77_017894 [Diaphorina citri]